MNPDYARYDVSDLAETQLAQLGRPPRRDADPARHRARRAARVRRRRADGGHRHRRDRADPRSDAGVTADRARWREHRPGDDGSPSSMTDHRGLVRTAPAHRRVRAFLGGEVVVDTVDALYVWEGPHYPQWYVPLADVATGVLVPTSTSTRSPSRGTATHYTVTAGGRGGRRRGVALRRQPDRGAARPGPLRLGRAGRLVRGGRGGHRPSAQPDTRVAILPSSRHVVVSVDGVVVADSTHPTFLHETGSADAHVPAEGRRADGPADADRRRRRSARTRARPTYWTLRLTDGTRARRPRVVATRRRCASRSRSPGSSRSTTPGSTSRSTACTSRARRADRRARRAIGRPRRRAATARTPCSRRYEIRPCANVMWYATITRM